MTPMPAALSPDSHGESAMAWIWVRFCSHGPEAMERELSWLMLSEAGNLGRHMCRPHIWSRTAGDVVGSQGGLQQDVRRVRPLRAGTVGRLGLIGDCADCACR